jgi:HEAT repeat protein
MTARMTWRSTKWLLLFFAVIAILWAAKQLCARDQAFDGKTLASWLREYDATGQKGNTATVDGAIRHFGTNAVPHLLGLLASKECPASAFIANLASKQGILRIRSVTADTKHARALAGLRALGGCGKELVPQLRRMNRLDNHQYVMTCLADLGEDGVAPLLMELTNHEAAIRSYAAYELGWVGHAKGREIAPLLSQSLADSDADVRYNAAMALGRFGDRAVVTVPALSNAAQREASQRVRETMDWALRRCGSGEELRD